MTPNCGYDTCFTSLVRKMEFAGGSATGEDCGRWRTRLTTTLMAVLDVHSYVHARRGRQRIERVLGHLKRNLGLRTLKLRGLSGATAEFTMAAAAYNLQLLARQAAPVRAHLAVPAAASHPLRCYSAGLFNSLGRF